MEQKSSINQSRTRTVIIIVAVLIAVLYGAAPLFLPAPTPATLAAQEFSADRAMQHVAVISKEPHPAGSSAMAEVAAYLMQALQADGWQPELQQATSHVMNQTLALRNVVARLPGTHSTGAVLIVAHPDSTPFGPGAGDNATGAATLLEVARAIKAGAPLQNDLIVLFDDGEEYGNQGGRAFAREHPWMADVRFAIGLDTAAWGPATVLQTIPANSTVIGGYAQAVKQAAAFGLYFDLDYTLGHDDSLIAPFASKGVPSLDLEDSTAVIEKHSSQDTLDRVNPASMQQLGGQVLALARQYGQMDLTPTTSPDESYFALWGVGLVHYPAAINLVLIIGSIVGCGAVISLGLRRKILSGKGLLIGTGYAIGSLLLAGLIGLAVSKLFEVVFPRPSPYIDKYLVPASLPVLIVTLMVIGGLYGLLRRRAVRQVGAANRAVAGLLPWLGLGLLAVIAIPVGSYTFVLPALLAVSGWAGVIGLRLAPASIGRAILLGLALIAGISLFIPNLVLMYLATGIDLWLTAMVVVLLIDLGLSTAN